VEYGAAPDAYDPVEEAPVGEILSKHFDAPDARRTFDRGRVELVTVGDITVGRTVYEPGFRWSECVKPIAGTESCQFPHLAFVVSGRFRVRLDDGAEAEVGPGDVVVIPAGHDGWVVGDEHCVMVDFAASMDYGKPPA
jgi:ethanolamine utilization protein EutQ (cupin superfamily)